MLSKLTAQDEAIARGGLAAEVCACRRDRRIDSVTDSGGDGITRDANRKARMLAAQ
jgi:hypothetical protein